VAQRRPKKFGHIRIRTLCTTALEKRFERSCTFKKTSKDEKEGDE
jgi:hypothetical protein